MHLTSVRIIMHLPYLTSVRIMHLPHLTSVRIMHLPQVGGRPPTDDGSLSDGRDDDALTDPGGG